MRRAWALVLVGCSTHIAIDDDAGPDASRSDATTTDDAAADAGGDAGGEAAADGGARWCDTRSPKAAFCDDFDQAGRTTIEDPDYGWMNIYSTAGTISDAQASSPPASALFVTPGWRHCQRGPAPVAADLWVR